MHSENISISAALLLVWERAFPRVKAIFEAWERWMAEIAGLGTALPCVPAYFNPCSQPKQSKAKQKIVFGLVKVQCTNFLRMPEIIPPGDYTPKL